VWNAGALESKFGRQNSAVIIILQIQINFSLQRKSEAKSAYACFAVLQVFQQWCGMSVH